MLSISEMIFVAVFTICLGLFCAYTLCITIERKRKEEEKDHLHE